MNGFRHTRSTSLHAPDRLRSSDSALSVSDLSKLLNIAPLTLLRWVKAKETEGLNIQPTLRVFLRHVP